MKQMITKLLVPGGCISIKNAITSGSNQQRRYITLLKSFAQFPQAYCNVAFHWDEHFCGHILLI